MNVDELIEALEKMPDRNYKLDSNQEKVIKHGNGPLWVIAGPGSGKTDSIVLRCIRLLVVDNVQPASIIMTTFTEKAARNLKNRISEYMTYLVSIDPSIKDVDYNRVRIDTLHGLCNDIMQEFRYTEYQNYTLLDDIEQRLFIMEHLEALSLDKSKFQKYNKIWEGFPAVFEGFDYLTKGRWKPTSDHPPNTHIRAKGLSMLFNRMVEDLVDIDSMKNDDESAKILAIAYEEYKSKLFSNYRCDFANVQEKFLNFLKSPESSLFLNGDGTLEYPGITQVLVDEYQDTNPIQEEIYFRLADNKKNLCVVGDDDQALYRFRGGTVECMVNFGNQCNTRWPTSKVENVFLSTNYRSNPGIISFYDSYINSFDEMKLPGARVADKPSLSPGSSIGGTYPPVAIHRDQDPKNIAHFFTEMIKGFKESNIITDWSECVLLLQSTLRTTTKAGPFMDAMDEENIPYYNPRARGLLEDKTIQTILGGLLEIIDPDSRAQNAIRYPTIKDACTKWRNQFNVMANSNKNLGDYVKKYAESILRKGPKTSVGVNLLEVFYDLLNYPPLSEWIDDVETSQKLGTVCNILDSYSNVPTSSNRENMLGSLYTSSQPNAGISFTWRKSFYYSLLGLLASEGLNESEDEIENFPKGKVPIMTIHQSKGLEFPIVFVYGLSNSRKKDDTSAYLESVFDRYKSKIVMTPNNFTDEQRTKQDVIRLFYVAYSRAQYALILLAKNSEYTKPGIGFGGNSKWTVFKGAKQI